jgi:hypothetical protein
VRGAGERPRLAVCALHITRCKFVQTIPNETKRNRLDSLGFPWPIRDFSKGYGESKQFFPFPAVSRSDMRPGSGSLAGLAVSIAAAGLIHVRGIVLAAPLSSKKLS